MVVALALLALTPSGAPNPLQLKAAVHHHAPDPPAELVFSQGPHPVCQTSKPRTPLGDACALHGHLVGTPVPSNRLQGLAQRVLKTLEGVKHDLLRARLLGTKARRSRPCLQQAGSGTFAAQEARMILTRQRDALTVYTRAMKSMERSHAGPLVDEIVALVRIPYENLAAQITPPIDAGFEGQIELLPRTLINAVKHLARSVGHPLKARHLAPISITTRRHGSRLALWREDNELLVRSPGSIEPLRLRGDAATDALRERLKADHDDVLKAAALAGIFGFAVLHERLVFLSELDNETLQRAGWVGRVGLAHADDHDAIVKWLIKSRPKVSPALRQALRRFSDLAGNRIKRVLPNQWPDDVLTAMISHSVRFDQRAWYTALLQHKNLHVRILAHAAMRKTKPEDWLTARLEKASPCAADHLRLLVPSQRAVRVVKRAAAKAVPAVRSNDTASEDEIEDHAGSIEIPEDDDPTAD